MNWGKGIIIGLLAFMTFIGTLVFKMFATAEDSFDKDYYEKGLQYDEDYQLKQQVITDKAAPEISQDDYAIHIVFTTLEEGTLTFKRPSDRKQDVSFSVDKKDFQISKSKLAAGEWKLIFRWTAGSKNYLYETNLFIP